MRNLTRHSSVFSIAACLGLISLLTTSALHGQSIVQLGLIVDASSSTEDELPTFRQGVADGIAVLKTDGSLELTLTQFSAEGLVIFGPTLMDSDSVRQDAINAALAIDPEATAIPPFDGGTNLEDAFLVTLEAMQEAPNADNASLQFVNMLTDGHPTSHNHLNFTDVDDSNRHSRGQSFAKAQRDALVAAGVDVISFEALGSSAADLEYLKTLAFPEPAAVLDGATPSFPSPITKSGFLLPIATVDGIAAALTAKFEAAGFAATLDPDPLTGGIEDVQLLENGQLQFSWTGRAGFNYQVEYSDDFIEWKQDLPNSLLSTALEEELLQFTADTPPPHRYFRVGETAQ